MKKRSFLLFALAATLVSGALAATPNAADVPATIPLGVTIGAVPVGGLTPQDAAAAVQQTFDRPLRLQLGATRISVTPDVLGATAGVDRAVQRALVASENTAVPLGVNAPGSSITPFVTKLAERYDRSAVDSSLVLRQMRPWLSKERPGSKLERRRAVQGIITALYSGVRGTIRLKQLPVRPKITRRNFGPVIVIRRSSNHLYLYRGMRFWRLFAVATGQAQYPTPLGRFSVMVKWRNPWWYPPNSAWAAGQKPIPPGPDNPLGTRWMGLSAPGVGIHGTPSDTSIGYSVSHGCIRMRISEAEWLFNHIDVGTTVFIVAG
ncbi:MAG TPA: L,D-transpeptidase [Gaiellaceae bacterium]